MIEHMDGLLQEEKEKALERTSHEGVMRVARSKIRLDGPTCVVTLAVHGGVGISRARVGDSPSCGCVRAWGGVLPHLRYRPLTHLVPLSCVCRGPLSCTV